MKNQTAKQRLADRLRLCRVSAGLSTRDAENLLGWIHPTILNLEAGRRSVRAEELPLLAKIYKISVEDLVGELCS